MQQSCMNLNKSTQYVSAKEIQRKYHVSSATLRRWNRCGEITSIRTPTNRRLYNLNEIETLFRVKRNGEKRRICYARVSSAHQKEDLERQVEDLRRKYPNHEIVQDIGSGLNWHRKGFEKMMKDVMDGKIEEIVCTHKDRLCRFGFELVEMIFQKFGVSLVVLNVNKTKSHDYQQELAEDLLAVVNVCCKKQSNM